LHLPDFLFFLLLFPYTWIHNSTTPNLPNFATVSATSGSICSKSDWLTDWLYIALVSIYTFWNPDRFHPLPNVHRAANLRILFSAVR
jgi:hypothetical protein